MGGLRNTKGYAWKGSILTFLVVLIFIPQVHGLPLNSVEDEYKLSGESPQTQLVVYDGLSYLLISYTTPSQRDYVVYDMEARKPLFSGFQDNGIIEQIISQEKYRESVLNQVSYQQIVKTALDLLPSLWCRVINADEIIMKEAIILTEDVSIQWIPKKCVTDWGSCKKIAKGVKSGINAAFDIAKSETPVVILAVYCEGEKYVVVKRILSPAVELDAIYNNLEQRMYFEGQLSKIETSTHQLDEHLSYSVTDWQDVPKVLYYISNEIEVPTKSFVKSVWAWILSLFTQESSQRTSNKINVDFNIDRLRTARDAINASFDEAHFEGVIKDGKQEAVESISRLTRLNETATKMQEELRAYPGRYK